MDEEGAPETLPPFYHHRSTIPALDDGGFPTDTNFPHHVERQDDARSGVCGAVDRDAF